MEAGSGGTTVYALRLGVVLAVAAQLAILLATMGGPFAPAIRVVAAGEAQLIGLGSLVGLAVVVAAVALVAAGAPIVVASAGLVTGVAVLLSDTALDQTLPPAVLLAGVVVRPAMPVVVLGLALAAATPGRSRRWTNASVATLLVAFAIAIVRGATYDPFLDPACAVRCETVHPLVPIGPAASLQLRRIFDVVAVLASVATVAAAGRAALLASRDRFRLAILVGAAALAIEIAIANLAAMLAPGTREVVDTVAIAAGLLGRLGLAVGFGWWAARAVQARVRFDQLAATVSAAESSHAVERLISAASGARATLTFPLPGEAAEIDANGDPMPPPGRGEVATPVVRLGAEIATIRHAEGVDGSLLVRRLSPAMRAAIEIERLRATRLGTLRLVRESRSRIVAAQDRERRRVERDLHDGAQQRILAAGVELSRAASRAERTGEGDAAELRAAADEASAALDALRQLARGVHPAILSQGLDAGLRSLAEDAQLPVTVEVGPLPPLGAALEVAVYRAVTDIVAAATKSGASHVEARVRSVDGNVEVDLTFDGAAPALPLRVADRIGAAGGDVELRPAPGDGNLVHAVLPCG